MVQPGEQGPPLDRLLHLTLPVVVTLHGSVHLLGAAKGSGWADLSELRQPIGTGTAVAWLGAAAAVLGSAVLLAVRYRVSSSSR